MGDTKYHINVRKIGKVFVLHNHDAIAGHRLFRGNSGEKDRPNIQWPFYGAGDNWNRHTKKADADTAAAKLQKYLDIREKQIG